MKAFIRGYWEILLALLFCIASWFQFIYLLPMVCFLVLYVKRGVFRRQEESWEKALRGKASKFEIDIIHSRLNNIEINAKYEKLEEELNKIKNKINISFERR